jgi:protein involved in polysaccharide export with SLBB domain
VTEPPATPPADPPKTETEKDIVPVTEPERPDRRFAVTATPDLQAIYAALPRFGQDIFVNATSAQPVTNAPVPPNYLIGPGDTLELKVWAANREQVNQALTVSPEGHIVVPQLGRLTLSGRTLEQLRQTLSEGYRRFYADPMVTLVLSEQRVIDVYVTGDAVRPGKYSLTGMATLFTALFAAGGPAPIGSYREVRLLRLGQPVVVVDLYDYLLRGQREADPLLQPGDSIFIPPLKTQVGLAGSVRRPRLYEIKAPETVGDAVAMAGGLEPTAYSVLAKHWRVEEDGKWHLTSLKLTPGSLDLKRTLKDGDLLEIAPVLPEPENTVEVLGAVRRPGHYAVTDGLTISGAIRAAEGLARNVHLGIAVHRRLKADTDFEVRSFDLRQVLAGDKTADVVLQAKDIVQIFSQEELATASTVDVQGAVLKPGPYEWNEGLRVGDLVRLAGGVKIGAYLERADLLRVREDLRSEIIPVALDQALAGDQTANLRLQRGDVLTVRDELSVMGVAQVHVTGYVRVPGIYPRHAGMRISDLLFQAGGLLPNANTTLEYARGRQVSDNAVLSLRVTNINGIARVEPDFILQDDDTVAIKGEGEMELVASTCTLTGRVQRPGSYVLKPKADGSNYTVWDLLQEAGALLPDANLDGLVLYRPLEQRMGEAQEGDLRNIVNSLNREQDQAPGTLSLEDQQAAMTSQVGKQLASVLETGAKVTIVQPPTDISTTNWVSAVPLEGRLLLATEGRQGNIDLMPGDIVLVPRVSDTVLVLGAVVRAGATPHVDHQPLQHYLALAGGTREDAALDRVVIIRANGSAVRWTPRVSVRAGDVIVVPTRYVIRTVRTEPAWETWLKSIASVAATAILVR